MNTSSTYTIESVHGLKQTVVLSQFEANKKGGEEASSVKNEK